VAPAEERKGKKTFRIKERGKEEEEARIKTGTRRRELRVEAKGRALERPVEEVGAQFATPPTTGRTSSLTNPLSRRA